MAFTVGNRELVLDSDKCRLTSPPADSLQFVNGYNLSTDGTIDGRKMTPNTSYKLFPTCYMSTTTNFGSVRATFHDVLYHK